MSARKDILITIAVIGGLVLRRMETNLGKFNFFLVHSEHLNMSVQLQI